MSSTSRVIFSTSSWDTSSSTSGSSVAGRLPPLTAAPPSSRSRLTGASSASVFCCARSSVTGRLLLLPSAREAVPSHHGYDATRGTPALTAENTYYFHELC